MQNVSGGREMLKPQLVLSELRITPGMTIADLGCGGTGHLTIPFAQAVGSTGSVYAIDIRRPVLDATVSRARMYGLQNIRPVWADLEVAGSTKLPDACVDVASFVNVISETHCNANVIAEAARLLKPRGQLLVVDWLPEQSPLGPDVAQRLTPAAVEEAIVAAGLVPVLSFGASRYHFGFVFEK